MGEAPTAEAAGLALEAFAESPWGTRFPPVVAAWRRAWTQVIPFFAFPPDIRRVIYTTNALESVHARLRKIIKPLDNRTARGFPQRPHASSTTPYTQKI